MENVIVELLKQQFNTFLQSDEFKGVIRTAISSYENDMYAETTFIVEFHKMLMKELKPYLDSKQFTFGYIDIESGPKDFVLNEKIMNQLYETTLQLKYQDTIPFNRENLLLCRSKIPSRIYYLYGADKVYNDSLNLQILFDTCQHPMNGYCYLINNFKRSCSVINKPGYCHQAINQYSLKQVILRTLQYVAQIRQHFPNNIHVEIERVDYSNMHSTDEDTEEDDSSEDASSQIVLSDDPQVIIAIYVQLSPQ